MASSIFILFSLLGIRLATSYELEPLSDEQIFYINDAQSSWTAGRNFKPGELERVRRIVGVDTAASKMYMLLHPNQVSKVKIRDGLPEQFDSRVKWPHCKSIWEIRDQSDCDSSWALAPTEAMTDRMCIHTKTQVHLSAEDVNDCCLSGGCDGGLPAFAWTYFQYSGVVSGGNYNSNEGCMPYSLPQCDHYVSGKYTPCRHSFPTPNCTAKCRKGYAKTYKEDKHYAQEYLFFVGEERIMQEIVDNGPVSAEMTVYSDFLSYKSGVYKHITGKKLGGQAVKIIGYGVENGQKFWFVANSWNEDWGNNGFFKIAKGSDECGIETMAIAALPKQ